MSRTKAYEQACKQVVAMIDHLPKKERAKIPVEKYEFYKKNMDESFQWEYREGLPPEEQGFTREANAIIVTIFRDYFATEKQKEQLDVILKKNDEKAKKRQYERLMEKERVKRKENEEE